MAAAMVRFGSNYRHAISKPKLESTLPPFLKRAIGIVLAHEGTANPVHSRGRASTTCRNIYFRDKDRV